MPRGATRNNFYRGVDLNQLDEEADELFMAQPEVRAALLYRESGLARSRVQVTAATIMVPIDNVRIQSRLQVGSVTWYRLAVFPTNGPPWTVDRRYRQFDAFRGDLKPLHIGKIVEPFPPKIAFGLTSTQLAMRQASLEAWLQQVLERSNIVLRPKLTKTINRFLENQRPANAYYEENAGLSRQQGTESSTTTVTVNVSIPQQPTQYVPPPTPAPQHSGSSDGTIHQSNAASTLPTATATPLDPPTKEPSYQDKVQPESIPLPSAPSIGMAESVQTQNEIQNLDYLLKEGLISEDSYRRERAALTVPPA